jgi:hypothetical protein
MQVGIHIIILSYMRIMYIRKYFDREKIDLEGLLDLHIMRPSVYPHTKIRQNIYINMCPETFNL